MGNRWLSGADMVMMVIGDTELGGIGSTRMRAVESGDGAPEAPFGWTTLCNLPRKAHSRTLKRFHMSRFEVIAMFFSPLVSF